MKVLSYTIALLSLFLLGACNRTKETVITGQIIGNVDNVIFSNPSQGTNYFGFRDTLFVDESGKFELRFNLRQPAFISLLNPQKQNTFRLLLEPGSQSRILIDTENGIEISGANEAGQRLLQTLPNPSWIEMELRGFREETSLTVIRERIHNLKKEELRQFRQLLDENKISTSFYDLITIDRGVYYASLEALISQHRMAPYLMYNNSPEFYEEYSIFHNFLENQRKIYAQFPPDNESLLLSSFWFEYAQFFFMHFVPFSQEDFDVLRSREQFSGKSGGALFLFRFNEAREHLTGKSLEFYQAVLIHTTAIQRRFEKELIDAFEQFKRDFPRSEYIRHIQPLIDKVAAFHNTELGENENIIFIENSENINTLAELIEPLRGRKIYIGIWATWCNPCISQFRYAKAMREILQKNDIQMLYISIDREEFDAQWKRMIKFHDLAGKHIRANDNLRNYLRGAIPRYILIDEEGNILQRNAQRPSQIVAAGNIYF